MDEKTRLNQLKAVSVSPVGGYTVFISPHIYERLEQHISILKKAVDRNITKQAWLINAIKEKLENDSIDQHVPKANTLSVKIEEALENLILERIEHIKKFRSSYSKKQWIIDAVISKLDRDQTKVEKQTLETTKNQDLTDKQQIKSLKSELHELKIFCKKLIEMRFVNGNTERL